MKYHLLDYAPHGKKEYIISLELKPNIIERILGMHKGYKKYIGDSTIWRDMDDFHRAGTLMEGMLSDIQYAHNFETAERSK